VNAGYQHTFTCRACLPELELELSAVAGHMQKMHGLAELKGTKRLTRHGDGRDFFWSEFTWTFWVDGEPIYLHEYIRQPRRGQSKAMWEDF
jgi:hypothetical protein